MQIDDRAGLDADTRAAIQTAIARHHTLEDVVRWRMVLAVITQDEYTHDVLVGWDEDLCLVYDTT